MNQPNFFAQLKRRNVTRVAGLYLVGAWLLNQAALYLVQARYYWGHGDPRFDKIVASLVLKETPT